MARTAAMTLGAAALAVLMVSALSIPAEARHGGHGGHGWSDGGHHSYGGGSNFRGFRHDGHRHRHFNRGGLAFYGPYGDYYYGDYGYGCGWLRRRAVYTGNSYWWHRYHACIDNIYD